MEQCPGQYKEPFQGTRKEGWLRIRNNKKSPLGGQKERWDKEELDL
jgi:hypothetical protein